MNTYQHTQPGTLIRVLTGIPALVVFAFLPLFPPPGNSVLLVVGGILVLALGLFHSLHVSIHEDYLRVRMGIGLIQTKFGLREITKATPVKNKWYYGWGIRLLEKGLLYNVSGLDAVEIPLSSGAIHRIGTDEPSILAEAINQAVLHQ